MKKWLIAISILCFLIVFLYNQRTYVYKVSLDSPFKSVREWGQDKLMEDERNIDNLCYVALYAPEYKYNWWALNTLNQIYDPELRFHLTYKFDSKVETDIHEIMSKKQAVSFLFDRYLSLPDEVSYHSYQSIIIVFFRKLAFNHKRSRDNFTEYCFAKLKSRKITDEQKIKLLSIIINFNWYWAEWSEYRKPFKQIDLSGRLEELRKNNSKYVNDMGFDVVWPSKR